MYLQQFYFSLYKSQINIPFQKFDGNLNMTIRSMNRKWSND